MLSSLLLACVPLCLQGSALDKAFALADNHVKAQKFEAAVAALRGAGADTATDGAVRTRYGTYLMRWTEWRIQSGDREVSGLAAVDAWIEVADVFDAASRLDGATDETYVHWSECLLNASDPAGARSACDDGLDRFASSAALLMQRARVGMAQARKAAELGASEDEGERYAEAEADLRAAMTKAPKSAAPCERLGELLITRWANGGSSDAKLRQQAIEIWTEGARRDPAGLNLNNTYAWLQADARVPLTVVLEKDPAYLDALWFRGLSSWSANPVDWPGLRDDLLKVLEKAPNFVDANFYLGDGAFRRGDELIAAGEAAPANEAFAAAAKFWTAYLAARVDVYAQSARQAADGGAALAERMTWLAGKVGPNPFEGGMGLHAEAATIMNLVVRLTPEDGYAWQNLGFFQREAAAYEDSRAAYARAHELLPDDPQVMNDYAVIHHYYLKSEDELAKDLYRRAAARAEAMLQAGGLTEADAERFRVALRDANTNLAKLEAGNRRN